MSTKFLSPGWRMPRNANQSKQSNYSIQFDGSNDYVYVDNPPALPNSATISVWVNFNNTPSYGGILSTKNYVLNANSWSLQNRNGDVVFVIQRGSGNYYIKQETPPVALLNNWNHIAVVFDSSAQTFQIYFNGATLGTSQSVTTYNLSDISNGLIISGYSVNGSIPPQYAYANSLIEAVAIFDYALSPSQVTTLYGNSTNGIGNPMALPSSPIAYYPLGTSAWDGNFLAENNAIGDYVFDFITNDSISFGNAIGNLIGDNYTGGLTISFWMNPDVTSSEDGIFNFSNNEMSLVLRSNSIRLYNNGQKASISYTNPNNEWSNCVISFLPSGSVFYLNGVSVANWTYTDLDLNGLDFTIGWYATTNYAYVGKLSNFQIWNTNLSLTDAQTLYNNGSPIQTLANIPQSSNLKAWYKLDASEVYNSTSTEWSIDNNQNPSAYISGLKCTSSNYLKLNAGYETPQILSSIPNKLSLSFWINAPSGQGGNMYFFSRSSNQIIINSQANNNLRYSIYPGTGAVTGSSILDGSWHHCIMVYDFSNTSLACYEDGVLIQKVTNASVLASRQTAMVLCTFGAGAGNSLEATVSNFCIWEDALSDGGVSAGQVAGGDVATLFNNGTPLQEMSSGPKYSTLRAWWKFDNLTSGLLDNKNSFNASAQLVSGQTTPVAEYAGFVNTLAGDSSGMTQANLVQSNLQTVAPYSKYAMNFDSGSSDYIDCGTGLGDTLGTYTGNLTFSIWFKTDTVNPANDGIFYIGDFNSQGALQVNIYNNNITFRADAGNGSKQFSFTDTTSWHNLTCVYLAGDRANSKLYLDGVLKSTSDSGSFPSSLSLTGLKTIIGSYYSSSFSFDGKLSNFSIWNTPLTSAQVSEIYNEGLPSNLNSHSAYSNLISWWQLGENSSFASSWICADEKGVNNGTSANMGVDALTNGVGTTANGASTGMSEGNLVGNAPYSDANAISSGMAVTARVTGSGNTP